ncbi:T9SS type A sorting domain-containing protein [Candidatus Neomarinimicrobiota bacterium]
MKKVRIDQYLLYVMVTLLTLGTDLSAQWEFLGLGGRKVSALELRSGVLYAGTDQGVFLKASGVTDTFWTPLGLAEEEVRALLALNSDTLLASVDVTGQSLDTAQAIYRTTDGGGSWHPFQNGFGGVDGTRDVLSIHALPGSTDTLLATGLALVAKSVDGGLSWKLVWGDWDGFGPGTHFLTFDPGSPQTIWAGGESGIMFPYLLKSTNYGETWQFLSIDGGGDNACYSLAIDPLNSNMIYVGMEGRIIKSSNGGVDWTTVLMPDSYPYFFGVAISQQNSAHVYAAGGINTDPPQDLVLYYSRDGGDTWCTNTQPGLGRGVTTIRLVNENGKDILYLGTWNDGVYRFDVSLVDLWDQPGELPVRAYLRQNHPNPFNPVSTIEYEVPRGGELSLVIYDLLGREVTRLVDGTVEPGRHQMQWNAHEVPAGVYIARLMTLGYSQSIKMVVLK